MRLMCRHERLLFRNTPSIRADPRWVSLSAPLSGVHGLSRETGYRMRTVERPSSEGMLSVVGGAHSRTFITSIKVTVEQQQDQVSVNHFLPGLNTLLRESLPIGKNCCIFVKPMSKTDSLRYDSAMRCFVRDFARLVLSPRRFHSMGWVYTMALLRFLFAFCVALTCFGGPSTANVRAASEYSSVAAPAQVVADTTERHTHARRLFVRGMTEAFLEDYATAIDYFEQSLELHSGQPAVLSALSDAHAAQGDRTSALFYARQAYVRALETPHYALRLAELQRQNGRIQEAIKTYRTLLDTHPRHVSARRALAETYTETGDLEAAASTYETLLDQSNAPLPNVRLDVLRLYRSLKDTDNVERTLHALIDLRPADPLYRRMLGRLYARQNRTDAAIALYEDLAEGYPGDMDVLMQLGTLYRQAGRPAAADSLAQRFMEIEGATPEQLIGNARQLASDADSPDPDSTRVQAALRMVQRALDQRPDDSEALALAGTLHRQMGAYETAASFLERALRANPRALDRWTLAVRTFAQANQPDKAIAIAEDGLMLFPGQVELVRAYGSVLMQAHRNQNALRQYQEALRLLGDDAPANERAALHTAVGRLLDRLSRPNDASRSFNSALALSPDHGPTLARYALHLADREEDRLSDAATYANRAIATTDSSALSLHAMGWVTFRQGHLERARDLLERAVDAGASADAYEHLGDLHQALGNHAAMRRAWQHALERAPHHENLRDKLEATQSVEK